MEAPSYTMGMTMDVNDSGNGDRQESQDANGSWNKQSHQALSSQPHHKEGAKLSSSQHEQVSSSHTVSELTETSKARTILATGRVSSISSSGDFFLRTAPVMNDSFFQMPSQIQDRYRWSIPAVSGLEGRDVTVPNVALQDEYAVEHNRIMFPNHSPRVQSGQSSSCSSDSCSLDGNESTEGGVISKPSHKSTTASFHEQDQIPEELDMTLPFPVKLHYIVSNPRFKEYIDWCPHGRAWRVLNQQAFERDVIPIFFRSAKFTSFMRQVSKGISPLPPLSNSSTLLANVQSLGNRSMVGRL
jgi:hypothetical protein